MDASSVSTGRGMGGDGSMPLGLDQKQLCFTNLQLLGFDAAAMEIKYKIPFNKEMFNMPNKVGAEAVLYFLFNRLDPTLCRQQFRDCWPVTDKRTESAFRKICCIWLQNIQKEEADAKLPRINASLFLSPGGDKFCHLLFAFSTYVVLHVIQTEYGSKDSAPLGYPTLTSQNKELAVMMEPTCTCAAIRHRKHFLETLAQTIAAKQSWQTYADEMTRNLRGLLRDVRELEREKREQVHQAAQRGVARGSPIPPSRLSHDFDMSAHTAKRALRVQQVRSLWKGVQGFMEKSREERELVSTIVDRTLQKYSIDAANIKISIPHLMLRECEQEMHRRQVDNIYEGGQLNLVSVLQLWNLALRMYMERVDQGGLKDLSYPANNMRSLAHAQHAYLANTSALREKMEKEIPQRKSAVEKLRRQFHSEVTHSSLGMIDPSPPVTFDPPRGHSGMTPTGPVLQMTPDLVETPEAAVKIANSVSRSSRRNLVETFQTTAFGVTDNQNWNRNNSNRLPQPVQDPSLPRREPVKQSSKSASNTRGRGNIQPRVVRHISRQSTSATSSAHKKPASSTTKKVGVKSGQPLASTPEKVSRPQPADLHRTPASSDRNNSAAETPRQRAHNILIDKIVSAVMHEDADGDESSYPQGLESLHPLPSATRSTMLPSASDISFSSLPASHYSTAITTTTTTTTTTTPSQRHPAATQRAQPATLFSDEDHSPSPPSRTAQDTQRSNLQGGSQEPSALLLHKDLASDGEKDSSWFHTARSPETLVQTARSSEAEDFGAYSGMPGAGATAAQRLGLGLEADGGGQEAEDASVQNPSAALSEDAFVTSDLLHRSPLAVDIRRMWQDAISDDAENQESPSRSDEDRTADWLDTDRSSTGSSQTPVPDIRQQPAVPSASASPGLLQPDSSHTRLTHSPPAHSHSTAGEKDLGGNSQHPVSGQEQREEFLQGFEERQKASQQTMINETLAFSTSFDEEDALSTDLNKVERSVAEWEEHLSALYDDHEDVEDESEKNGERHVDDAATFNSALDELFQARAPVHSPHKVSGRSGLMGSFGATPERKTESPLISFTPQNTGQGAGFDLTNASPFTSTGKDLQTAAGEKLASNTGPASKENGGTAPALTSFLKASLSKKVTFSPDSSPRSCNGQGPELRDELLREDELIDTSGASLLDESFTPLQAGLFVQGGKSPGRSASQQSAARGLPSQASSTSTATLLHQASSTSTAASLLQANSTSTATSLLQASSTSTATSLLQSTNSLGGLDENLAAQLNRLRKVAAEAFRNCEASGVGVGAEGQEEDEDQADGDETRWLATSQRPAAVGKEQQLPEPASDPLNIFDEDDSILLPASP